MSTHTVLQQPAGLDHAGRLMVKLFMYNAESLITDAQQGADSGHSGSRLDRNAFVGQVRRLMDQRRLATEIAQCGLEADAYAHEHANLQRFLDALCRKVEVRVLSLWRTLARRAGDSELTMKIADLLDDLLATG